MTRDEVIAAAADRLDAAATSGVPASPLTDLLGSTDIDLAYDVQRTVTERRLAAGARLIGRKIGLTSEAIQSQVGVDQPDFGVLLDDMRFGDDEPIPVGRLLQPRAEAEVAFLLGSDITDPDADMRAAVALAFPAIEVVDSRVADWRIQITDTVADNASSGVFVVGERGATLDEVEPADVVMTMTRNGEEVSSGDGRACLGDPLHALAWLARTAIRLGDPLRAGDLVLSGALGPMIAARPGDVFVAQIAPLGRVTARFAPEGEEE
jgi:2-keto-4-pentenoate hydratase